VYHTNFSNDTPEIVAPTLTTTPLTVNTVSNVLVIVIMFMIIIIITIIIVRMLHNIKNLSASSYLNGSKERPQGELRQQGRLLTA
jgi:hypothetical protein